MRFLPWKTVYNLEASRAPGPSGPFRSTVGFSDSKPVFFNSPKEINGLGQVLQETGGL